MSHIQRLLALLYLVGFTTTLFAFLLLIPAGVSLYLGESSYTSFRDVFIATLALGAALFGLMRKRHSPLRWPDGFLLVTLTWTVLPLIASMPFWLYFARIGEPISFAHAYFEAVSGLTTTGSSVLNDLASLPKSIHVWRATLMWVGGLGVLVLAVAVLPHLGVGGSQVMRAETPGPMKDEKLTPRITSTAKGLYAIYLGLSALCALAYFVAGIRGTDIYIHMAATVSLGGFSSFDSSLGAFDNRWVEVVAMVFMLLSGINFATHFNAVRAHSPRPYWRCAETPYFLLITLSMGLFISLWLFGRGVYPDLEDALRYGMFNTISLLTTTGFSNTDYSRWPIFAPLLLLTFSCFTVSSASPGSGLKLIRMVLLIKHTRQELLRVVHPRAVVPIRLGGRTVEPRVMQGILAFLLLYIATLVTSTLLLIGSGLDPISGFSAALASLNNLGPGLGDVGPIKNYSELTSFQTWVCTVTMLLGRLELVTILVLLTPTFWRR